jgi:hypothetical protein
MASYENINEISVRFDLRLEIMISYNPSHRAFEDECLSSYPCVEQRLWEHVQANPLSTGSWTVRSKGW